MATKTLTVEQLEAERGKLQDALRELAGEQEIVRSALAQAQAITARYGQAPENADLHERRREELALYAERLAAGLAAVDADLVAARETERTAERERREKRLKSIRAEAGKLCDQLQSDLTDRAAWNKLGALHSEHLALRRELYGLDALGRAASSPFDWLSPAEGLARYCAALKMIAFGDPRPPEYPDAYRQLHSRDWSPPVRSLREALGL